MNLILDDVVQILATGLIPLLRISALLLAAPLVSLRVVSFASALQWHWCSRFLSTPRLICLLSIRSVPRG